jgi:hypothetical protein
MTSVFHSSADDSWGTPPEIIEAARRVLGRIDLDPFSSDEWNKTVKAQEFYSEDPFSGEAGFDLKWHGNVFMNPPGGKWPKGHPRAGRSKAGAAWDKLMTEFSARRVKHAIVVVFSLNQLQSCNSMCSFPLCVPASRLKYRNAAGDAKSPPHASAIVYVPGTVDERHKFQREFDAFGAVLNVI